MYRKFHYLIPFLVIALVLGGCQQSDPQAKEDTEKSTKAEKLSVTEVIQKNQKALQENKGSSYTTEGTQDFIIEANGSSQKISQTVKMDIKMTNDPASVHTKGAIQGNGQTIDMEMYQVGDEIYQKAPNNQWLKSKGANLQVPKNQMQKPNQTLKQLIDLISGDKNEKFDFLSMKETEDEYLLTLDIGDPQSGKIHQEFMKQFKAEMMPGLKQSGLPVQEDRIKFTKVEQLIHIDKKSFENSKTEQTVILEIPVSQGDQSSTIKVEQAMTMKRNGEFNGTIEVPQEIKDQAKEFTP
ncbi:DUF6612 family protein [Melghirimyces algeriensis]|uniref:Lipoprotein n=1 Tax=Melghirimyces algeriensis TaxID=910412 RepID=A0A521E195_9BACL|nr:DUF6612 family protein [Melghirimyces algeriensis]SMO77698.1 hypothetical protein SAMN06264849_107115 [Melghirimyces algeriensis]